MDLEVWCFIAQDWKYFSIVTISCSGLLWTLLDQEERLDGIISFQTKRIIFFLNDQYIEQHIPISTQSKNKTKSLSDLHSHLSTHPPTHIPRQNIDTLHISLSWKPKGQDLTGERLSSINEEKTDFVVMNWHRNKPFPVMWQVKSIQQPEKSTFSVAAL